MTRGARSFARDDAIDVLSTSRAVTVANVLAQKIAASVRGARSLAQARRVVAAATALAPRERRICAALIVAAALIGHTIMASMLPLPSRPTVWLTAGSLLASSLAAVAAIARSR